jgi:YHS domain-containing protein
MTAFIIKVLLVLLLIRALWRLLHGVVTGLQDPARVRRRKAPVSLSRDPVCGTYVVPGRALPLRDGALVRYFCSERCRDEYARTPRATH